MIFLSKIFLLVYIFLLPITLTPTKTEKTLFGQASYYADKFHGRRAANGEIFDQTKLTAACNSLPLGTWVRVTNLKNDSVVVLRTTDRLAKHSTRVLDVSKAAAKQLGFFRHGLTQVKIEVI